MQPDKALTQLNKTLTKPDKALTQLNKTLTKPDKALTQLNKTLTKPDKALTQLKRIRGQLDGIIKMYEDERGCVDIVRQIIAARGSLGRVSRDLLSGEAVKCSKNRNPEELDKILKEVFRN